MHAWLLTVGAAQRLEQPVPVDANDRHLALLLWKQHAHGAEQREASAAGYRGAVRRMA